MSLQWPITLKNEVWEESLFGRISWSSEHPPFVSYSYLVSKKSWHHKNKMAMDEYPWWNLLQKTLEPKKHFRSKMIMGKRFAYPHHCLRPIVRKGKEGSRQPCWPHIRGLPFSWCNTTEFNFVHNYPLFITSYDTSYMCNYNSCGPDYKARCSKRFGANVLRLMCC